MLALILITLLIDSSRLRICCRCSHIFRSISLLEDVTTRRLVVSRDRGEKAHFGAAIEGLVGHSNVGVDLQFGHADGLLMLGSSDCE